MVELLLFSRNEQGKNLKSIKALAFSPDGAKIYTASEGAAEVLEWDLKVRQEGYCDPDPPLAPYF